MSTGFELWRQDDNGQRVLIERFAERPLAEQRLSELDGRGHKQLYWIENATTTAVANLLVAPPGELPEEFHQALLSRQGLRLDRIISRQHATPAEQWYDQAEDEWVLLVSGSAELQFCDPPGTVSLLPGDHLFIPAHRRHRVEATDPLIDTVWLALYLPAEAAAHG